MNYEQIKITLDLVLDESMQENLNTIEAYYNGLDKTQEWSREKVLEMVIRNGFAFRLADAAETYKDLIENQTLDN